MKFIAKLSFVFFIFSGVLLADAIHASAYIDPSIVTYIISVVSGILVAGGAGVAIYRRKIAIFFKKFSDKKGKGGDNELSFGSQASFPMSENKYLAD